jgi:hypothetical protein
MSIYLGETPLAGGGTTDQTYDATSTNAQSGTAVAGLLEALYPVGSIYITTAASCPLSALINGSTWALVSSGIVTNVNTNVPCKGNGKTLGLTDGTNNYGLVGANGSGNNAFAGIYNTNVGTTVSGASTLSSVGVTTDSSKSGIVGTVTRSTLAVNIFRRTA